MGSATPEVSDVSDPDHDATTTPGAAPGRSKHAGRGPLLVLGVALAGVVVALLLVWNQGRDDAAAADLRSAEASATSAASDIAVAMTSYDFKTVDEDFSWVEDDGTDAFQETYGKSTQPIRELVEKTKAHAEGTVTDAAGTADDTTHVTVLLFVDQALSHQGGEKEVDSSRVVMHMVLLDGRWLVDDVELR